MENTQGNKCGHNPKAPRLSPILPIKTGKGGLPRILSLAAEKTKAWYDQPNLCPKLQSKKDRRTRSERREAVIVIIETLLKHMDLATLQIGFPGPQGFIDIDMRTIVRESGLSQRRCERAITQLKQAGFMTVKQPRIKRAPGVYSALRAIRIITRDFFAWLGLDRILDKERHRTAAKTAHKLMRSLGELFARRPQPTPAKPPKPDKQQTEFRRAWSAELGKLIKAGVNIDEAQRQLNERHRLPYDWSPGKPLPRKF